MAHGDDAVGVALIARWTEAPWRTRRSRLLDGGTLGDGERDLRGIDLAGARLDGVDLLHARLDLARLDGASFDRAILDGASLALAHLVDARLEGARLAGANLTGAILDGASLVRADLRRADLRGAIAIGADLRCADLRGALLENCDLEGAVWWGARRDRPAPAVRALGPRGYPTFAEVAHLYLAALQLHSVGVLVPALEAAAWAAPSLDDELRGLTADGDWRPHAILAATLALATDHAPSPSLIDAMWQRLPSSWAAPQLAAALWLRDPEFERRATHALAGHLDDKARASLRSLVAGAGESIATRWLARARAAATSVARAAWLR